MHSSYANKFSKLFMYISVNGCHYVRSFVENGVIFLHVLNIDFKTDNDK